MKGQAQVHVGACFGDEASATPGTGILALQRSHDNLWTLWASLHRSYKRTVGCTFPCNVTGDNVGRIFGSGNRNEFPWRRSSCLGHQPVTGNSGDLSQEPHGDGTFRTNCPRHCHAHPRRRLPGCSLQCPSRRGQKAGLTQGGMSPEPPRHPTAIEPTSGFCVNLVFDDPYFVAKPQRESG